jgi:hypothetical protein
MRYTWSYKDIEAIHAKFLRRILGVKRSINLSTFYGQLGRIPLLFILKINMIRYLIKISKQNDIVLLLKRSYLILKVDADRNLKCYGKNGRFR